MQTSDVKNSAGEPKLTLHPPMALWKFALLMIATASLYQFVWLYRVAQDLRSARDASITPWHWVMAPLLGPFVAVVGHHLAVYLQAWQEEDGREAGHFAEPVLPAMFMAVAYLPALLVAIEVSLTGSLALIVALMLCVPFMILQHQLNLIKVPMADDAFASPRSQFTRNQIITIVIGSVLAAPLYILGFSETWEKRSASGLAPDTIVVSDSDFSQIRISDAGWSQVDAGYLSDESDLEFLGPDEWTWAIVFESSDLTVDELLSYRIDSIKTDYKKASCEQNKTLIEESLIVRGTLHCSGRDAVEGQYMYAGLVLAQESKIVELIAFTSQRDKHLYETMSARVHAFADGLEIKD